MLKVSLQDSVFRVQEARKGFTVLELLLVVAIIGVLFALLFPAFQPLRQSARDREAEVTKMALANAIRAFRSEYGYWPTADDLANQNVSILNISGSDQYSKVVQPYLLSTATLKNTRQIPFWDVDAPVTNVSNKQLFSIKIDVLKDTVTVQ
jgi:prepilin-type N-terminal cleavage/methylation domain-containing protein